MLTKVAADTAKVPTECQPQYGIIGLSFVKLTLRAKTNSLPVVLLMKHPLVLFWHGDKFEYLNVPCFNRIIKELCLQEDDLLQAHSVKMC